MRPLAIVGGLLLLLFVLWDAFETVVLPRRVSRRFRLTRAFYRLTWIPWRAIARRWKPGNPRENFLSVYGPLSLLLLLALWATGLIFGFAFLQWGLGTRLQTPFGLQGFAADLYYSGTTLFTIGLGDVSPTAGAGRFLTVVEGGTGFGFLALVIGYLPTMYDAFSRREVNISLLDARAGSPPTAAELLRRHSFSGAEHELSALLSEWERWSAELLESHISYTLLCYFRSQHTNQSWIGALTSILDASALLIAGVRGHEARQAQLTFAMARHALVDLSQIFSLEPKRNMPDRLPRESYDHLYQMLCGSGVRVCRDDQSYGRLREMRALYEPYAESLSAYLRVPLPPWIASHPHKDNWQAVAKLRARADAANPASSADGTVPGAAQSIARFVDEHHEF